MSIKRRISLFSSFAGAPFRHSQTTNFFVSVLPTTKKTIEMQQSPPAYAAQQRTIDAQSYRCTARPPPEYDAASCQQQRPFNDGVSPSHAGGKVLSPQSNAGSPNSAHGLSPSDCEGASSPQQQSQHHRQHNSPPLVQILRANSDTSPQSPVRRFNPSSSYSNAASPAFSPYIPAKGHDYRPNYYPAMPKGYDSPSTLPSLLPIRQLECPPPSRSLAEQKSDVVGGAIEGKLCRDITLTRVEIRNSYLVNCTLINCISKGCYFTSSRLFASDIVNAPCVISCSLEDSFISLSILSNCKMLQGAVKESRIMDCDIEAAGVFYCRLTRSIFFQCEYKEIEQVDCELRECDGNGDVDAFFPIVPPPPPKSVAVQPRQVKETAPEAPIQPMQTRQPEAISPPVPISAPPTTAPTAAQAQPSNQVREKNAPEPHPRSAPAPAMESPSREDSECQAAEHGPGTTFRRVRSGSVANPNGTLVQPSTTGRNSSPAPSNSVQLRHGDGRDGEGRYAEGSRRGTDTEAMAFNNYFQLRNDATSGAPYPHPGELSPGEGKVGKNRRGNMFCFQ